MSEIIIMIIAHQQSYKPTSHAILSSIRFESPKNSLFPVSLSILIMLSTFPCFHFQAPFRAQDRCVAQALMAP